MKQPQELIANYEILLNEHPHVVTLKAKYNACANKLNRDILNQDSLTESEKEELVKKIHVIKQLILAHQE
jgi:Trp operon repressor